MVDLDNLAEIKKLDQSNTLGSIELLHKQCREIWEQGKKLSVPEAYKKVKNIVVVGMGGSALGAHIVKTVFSAELKVSLEIVNDYHLPAYVNKETLVLLSSYSGATEEVLNAAKEVGKKQAKVLAISAGGELAKVARRAKWPALIFNPLSNPAKAPRMGLGYSVFGQIALFSHCGFFNLAEAEFKRAVGVIAKYQKVFGAGNSEANNPAKKLARLLLKRVPIYVSSEHLLGNLHAATNQLNENAKVFGNFFAAPELHHHLLEGLRFPAANRDNLFFIIIESALFDKRLQKSRAILKDILTRQGISYAGHVLQEKTKLNQACEMLVFGSFVSFYLAMLEGVDPTPIPQVDDFKEAMRS